MQSWLQPCVLKGKSVQLQALEPFHREGLLEAAGDGKLWELWYTSVPSETTVDAYVDFALAEQKAGRSLPFVVVERASGRVIGSTRFCNAEAPHKRLEIGYTWYAKSQQRTSVNSECKYLMLTHAFERLGCIAVEFRTHIHNHPSRRAISRLGAKQEGILRNHRIGEDGIIRDTVVFSIIQNEWAAVKKSLEHRLLKNRG